MLVEIRTDRGFALPLTIFLIAILTLMLGATFTRAATENRIAAGSKSAMDALFVAQAGLDKYFGQDFATSNRPSMEDSVRVDVPGGWAWVVPDVLITPTDTLQDFRYIVRSTGYVENPSVSGDALASHTVAQLADWQQASLNAPSAALIAANGLKIEGDEVVIDGRDRVNSLCSGAPLLPDAIGARLPAGSNSDLDDAEYYGSPDSLVLGTRESVAQLVNIDWAAIRAGGFTADYTSPQRGLPGTFPSQVVIGDYTEGNSWFWGEGLLIVTGDFTVSESRSLWYWRGVILVGGRALIKADRVYIYGTMITGLNNLTGDPPANDESELGGEDVFDILFDACNIRKSLGVSVKGFVPLENTWMDNWATF